MVELLLALWMEQICKESFEISEALPRILTGGRDYIFLHLCVVNNDAGSDTL